MHFYSSYSLRKGRHPWTGGSRASTTGRRPPVNESRPVPPRRSSSAQRSMRLIGRGSSRLPFLTALSSMRVSYGGDMVHRSGHLPAISTATQDPARKRVGWSSTSTSAPAILLRMGTPQNWSVNLPARFETIPSRPSWQALANTSAPSADRASLNRMLPMPWTTRESSFRFFSQRALF